MSRATIPVLATLALAGALTLGQPVGVKAHGGSEANISLDGDPELKEAVIAEAQKFLDTKKRPVSFSSLNGLIAANMDKESSVVVLIDHTDFGMEGEVRVSGFKDGSLSLDSGPARPEGEIRKVAEAILAKLPETKRRELYPLGNPQLDQGLYFFSWQRKVKSVPVLGNEKLNVGVNAHTAKVVFWELLIFDFPEEMMELTPKVSKDDGVRMAIEAVSKDEGKAAHVSPKAPPGRVVTGREVNWAVLVKVDGRGKPVWTLVHGQTGETEVFWSGAVAGELRQIFGAP